MEQWKQDSEAFTLFTLDEKPDTELGFNSTTDVTLTSLPPAIEVFPNKVLQHPDFRVEPVKLNGRTLLKGRVSTKEVFALSNSDLVPGKYEGGLKLWEASLDLVNFLCAKVQDGDLLLKGKRVLEVGCGHGLPGIFACLEGAALVHFQDFNVEVLQSLTIPNVDANLESRYGDEPREDPRVELRFFAGDWREVHGLLPCNYDIILMAETVYSVSSFRDLHLLIKKCMSRHGLTYLAAKKYYFGVGGGTSQFVSFIEKYDGDLATSLVKEVSDGSSNVRELWKIWFK